MTATKYVTSNTRDSSDWQPSRFLSGDIAEKVRELKQQDGTLRLAGGEYMAGVFDPGGCLSPLIVAN